MRRFGVIAALLFCVCITATTARAALTADQLLLIVNQNNPDSRRLADLYVRLRGVPPDRICTLNLPDDEQMSFDDYEHRVVGPVRDFLKNRKLEGTVTCLVTFYGVPFRIEDRVNSTSDLKELADLKAQESRVADQADQAMKAVEAQGVALDPNFKPGQGTDAVAMDKRERAVCGVILRKIPALPDVTQREAETKRFIDSLRALGGLGELDLRVGQGQIASSHVPADQKKLWVDIHTQVIGAMQFIARLQTMRWDPDAREQLRQAAIANFGVIGTLRILQGQITYFATDHTGSATDSELALLWWDYYSRENWIINPLNYHFHGEAPRTVMVMRLDGPDPGTVEKMMRTSIDVEKTGLQGIVALNARGIAPIDNNGKSDPFGQYDERIRNLALLLHQKTTLRIKLDDEPKVFLPHTVKNVALYCGWYSVGEYVPGCDFNPGAIGFHVASYEMLTLHYPTHEWVRGLLSDGCVSTLGPVAEPYLSTFPKPDEFFPFLLTGKLSLAECYWKTLPTASWMIDCIGDPLYTPYQANPALKVSDLPQPMQATLDPNAPAEPSPTTGSR